MKRGLTKAQFSMRPEQLEALRVEAVRRADERGARRLDTSEVLREAVDAWMRRRK